MEKTDFWLKLKVQIIKTFNFVYLPFSYFLINRLIICLLLLSITTI